MANIEHMFMKESGMGATRNFQYNPIDYLKDVH